MKCVKIKSKIYCLFGWAESCWVRNSYAHEVWLGRARGWGGGYKREVFVFVIYLIIVMFDALFCTELGLSNLKGEWNN